MKAVSLKDLGISFPNIKVFENVSLDIQTGDFVAVIGPNGSGKSTLLKIIAGLLKPDSGEVELFGRDIKSFDGWNKVNYISQTPMQTNRRFPVSVKEVVAMGLDSATKKFRPWLDAKEKEKIEKALELVGMKDFSDNLFGELSGGQKQKVLLAKSFASERSLLLLDEPTSGIDADAKIEIYDILKKSNNDSKNTVIMVSHDMELAITACSRVLCLEKGGMCYWGDANALLTHRHKSGYYFAAGCVCHEHV